MSEQIKKADLVAAISDATSVDKKSVSSVLDSLAAEIAVHMKKGNSVPLAGLGKFSVRDRAERTVRNPSTGETRVAPADKVVKMTLAKALKDSVK